MNYDIVISLCITNWANKLFHCFERYLLVGLRNIQKRLINSDYINYFLIVINLLIIEKSLQTAQHKFVIHNFWALQGNI